MKRTAPPARPVSAAGGAASRRTIGEIELVSIADFGIERLPVRVDTGARTSALHVEHLRELGNGRVSFELGSELAPIEAVISRRGRVRSTSGELQTRLFVTTRVRLGDVEDRVELGLVDRGHMHYRMLLGRSALAGRFVVDVARRFVLGR
jgi:hypothetical protein